MSNQKIHLIEAPTLDASVAVAAGRSARNAARARAALGLVEVVVSLLITSLLLSAAVRTLSAAKRRETRVIEQSVEFLFAKNLLHEVLRQAYADPDQPAEFGPEPGEQDGTRSRFDDADDYHGLRNAPPESREGVKLTGFDQLEQSVVVEWVSVAPPHSVQSSETGLKRITVKITRAGVSRASAVGYRSAGFQNRNQP